MSRIDWILALSIVLIFGGVFSFFGAKTLTGLADADEIVGVSIVGGVVHPPGYPVLSSLIDLTTSFGAEKAAFETAHNLAGWLQAISVGLVYVSGIVLLQLIAPDAKIAQKRLVAGLLSVWLGLSGLFWQYGLVLEMVQLAGLLLVLVNLLSFALIHTYQQRNMSNWLWFGLWLVWGMAILHQQVLLWLTPGMMWLLFLIYRRWQRVSKITSVLLAFIGVGLSFIVSMVLLMTRDPAAVWSWQVNESATGWMRFLLRQDFSGVHTETGTNLQAYFSTLELWQVQANVMSFVRSATTDVWGVVGLILLLLGILRLIGLRNKIVAIFIGLNMLGGVALGLYIPALPASSSMEYWQNQVIVERFYSLIWISFSWVVLLGMWMILEQISKLHRSKKYQASVRIILTLLLLFGGIRAYELISNRSMAEFDLVTRWAESIFEEADRGVVLCFSDVSCFSLLSYAHVIDPSIDTVVVPVTPQIKQNSVDENRLTTHDYGFNPERVYDVIFTQIAEGKPVYVSEIDPFYIDALGMEGQLLHLLPRGYMQQISCELDREFTGNSTLLSEGFIADYHQELDSAHKNLLAHFLAENHELQAILYGRMGKRSLAAEEITAGLGLVGDHGELAQLAQQLPYYAGDPRYQVTEVCRDSAYWQDLADRCEDSQDVSCSLRYLLWAHLLDITNTERHLAYAQALVDFDQKKLAQIHYETILTLDPKNATAATELRMLHR